MNFKKELFKAILSEELKDNGNPQVYSDAVKKVNEIIELEDVSRERKFDAVASVLKMYGLESWWLLLVFK